MEKKPKEKQWATRREPATAKPTITIQTVSFNLVRQQLEIQVRLLKTNQIIIERSKYAVLQQLEAKRFHEEYAKSKLQQDAQYRHIADNLERTVVNEVILTRQYLDETGTVKPHQALLSRYLLQELLQSLHGTAQRHPGISNMLPEIRRKYYYHKKAKHVKKWVEGCQ